MVHAGCGFVAGIHPSTKWTSGSTEIMRFNACVRKLDLGLYSHAKELGGSRRGMESEPMLTPKGKQILSTGAQRRNKPATLHYPGQGAQHTTNWAIPAPIPGLFFHSVNIDSWSVPLQHMAHDILHVIIDRRIAQELHTIVHVEDSSWCTEVIKHLELWLWMPTSLSLIS